MLKNKLLSLLLGVFFLGGMACQNTAPSLMSQDIFKTDSVRPTPPANFRRTKAKPESSKTQSVSLSPTETLFRPYFYAVLADQSAENQNQYLQDLLQEALVWGNLPKLSLNQHNLGDYLMSAQKQTLVPWELPEEKLSF